MCKEEKVVLIEEEEKFEFTPKNVHALLCILLKLTGPISLRKEDLDNFPEGVKWNANLDEVNRIYYISLPLKRKRRIIKTKKKLILPRIM